MALTTTTAFIAVLTTRAQSPANPLHPNEIATEAPCSA